MSPADISLRARFARSRLILAAGLRLATAYAAGVLLLLAGLMLWTREWVSNVGGVMAFHAGLGAFLLIGSFVALVTLRRAGLVAIWLTFLSVWFVGPLRWIPIGVLAGFVWWSILAFPLYVLTVIGFPAPPARAARVRAPHIIAAGWITLLAVTLKVTPAAHLFLASVLDGAFDDPPASFLRLVPSLWGPVPVLIAIHAIVRIARRRPKRD